MGTNLQNLTSESIVTNADGSVTVVTVSHTIGYGIDPRVALPFLLGILALRALLFYLMSRNRSN